MGGYLLVKKQQHREAEGAIKKLCHHSLHERFQHPQGQDLNGVGAALAFTPA